MIKLSKLNKFNKLEAKQLLETEQFLETKKFLNKNKKFFTYHFLRDEYRGEKLITWFRLIFFFGIFAILLLFYLLDELFLKTKINFEIILITGGIFFIYILMFFDLRHTYNNHIKFYKPYYRYIITILDLGIIFFLVRYILQIIEYTIKDPSSLIISAFILAIIYFFFMMAGSLRLDPWNIIFTMVLSQASTTILFYNKFDYDIHFTLLSLLLMGGLISTTITANLRLKVMRLHATSQLERFLPVQLVEEIANDNISIETGGKSKEAAVLFSDIRGFTKFSEDKTPEEVIKFLNLYFNEMINIVFKYNGTLDKFIGDAIMAVYGAPISFENDVKNSVETAIDMVEKLNDFNKMMIKMNYDPIKIGVGIDFGEVIAGNIGNEKRLEYTVIGDVVNTASRVESLTKELGCEILVTENIYNRTKDFFNFNEGKTVQIRGKSIDIKVFQVLGRK